MKIVDIAVKDVYKRQGDCSSSCSGRTGRGTGGGDPGRVSGSSAAYAGREQEFFPDGSGGVKK